MSKIEDLNDALIIAGEEWIIAGAKMEVLMAEMIEVDLSTEAEDVIDSLEATVLALQKAHSSMFRP